MIPFEELVAALDRWRMRNGLPVVTGELPLPSSPRPAPVAQAPAYVAAAPATAPAPVAARPPTDDVYNLDDADVAAEEEIYSNEGDDFAMQFDGGAQAQAPAAAPPSNDSGAYAESYPAEGYTEGEPSYEEGYQQQAAYEHPGYAEEEDASAAIEGEEEAEEDWSKMPGFPGAVPADHDDDGERTVVGDDRHRGH